MPLVYLIRHGQASFEKKDYDELSEKGAEQSQILGNFLKKTGLEFDYVYSGSLKRQKDTAFHTLQAMGQKDLKVQILKGLNEYDHISLIESGLKYLKSIEPDFNTDILALSKDRKKFQAFFSDLISRWLNKEFVCEGSYSTYESYSNNVFSAFEQITDITENNIKIGVFTSGGPISVMLENTLGLTSLKAVETGWTIANCSVSVLSIKKKFNSFSNQFRLRTFNSYTHFELEENKNIITYR